MGFFRGIKKVVTPFVSFHTWMDTKTLVKHGKTISETTKSLFSPRKNTHTETFEAAMQRLNLTEKTLAERRKEFKRLVIIFSSAAAPCFSYSIYLAYNNAWTAAALSFVLSLLLLTQAFRYHFWLFQIKRRKLGCTFKEWLTESLWG